MIDPSSVRDTRCHAVRLPIYRASIPERVLRIVANLSSQEARAATLWRGSYNLITEGL